MMINKKNTSTLLYIYIYESLNKSCSFINIKQASLGIIIYVKQSLILTSVAISLGFPASFVHTRWSPVPTVTYKIQLESLKSLKFKGKNAVNLLKYN